jgi:hypothetical protein
VKGAPQEFYSLSNKTKILKIGQEMADLAQDKDIMTSKGQKF